ncbi:WG repeat-containing protein [Ferruginibacter sp.]
MLHWCLTAREILWGYSNPDKKIIIKPAFQEANWFVAGYAVVKKGNKYGYIDETGKLVIPYKFYSAKPFTWGYFDDKGKHTAGGKVVKNQDTVLFAGASLKPNGAEVCIDTKGRVMSKCPAINEEAPGNNNNNEQLVMIDSQKVYGLVNNGNLYDKLVDDYKVAGDEHTYYIGTKNGMYGVINNTFDVVLPFEFSSLKKTDVNGNLYLVAAKNGLYGMYTGNGTVFIPVEKTKLNYIKSRQGNVYFIESKDGVASLKDLSQKDIISSTYSDIVYDENRGFVLTASDNTKGYYFLENKLIAPKYNEVRSIRGGAYLFVKTKEGKIGYINTDGVEYFEN